MDLDVESALLNLSDRVSLVKQPRSQSKTTKLERELSMTRMELAQLKLQFDKQRKLIHDQERMRHELALKESLAYEHKRQADQALVMLESVLDVALSQAESQLLLSSSLLEDFHFLLHDFHSPLFIKSDYGYGSRDDCSVPTLAPQDPENRSGASTPETIFSPSEPITPLSQASESIGDPIASFEKMAVAFEKSVEKAIDRPWKLVPSWFG